MSTVGLKRLVSIPAMSWVSISGGAYSGVPPRQTSARTVKVGSMGLSAVELPKSMRRISKSSVAS